LDNQERDWNTLRKRGRVSRAALEVVPIQVDLGLKDFEAPPCEIRAETIGGLTEIWMADPRGIDSVGQNGDAAAAAVA
jgi:hypothetical protein